MTLQPNDLLSYDFSETEHVLTPQAASLYALGIGLGDKALDRDALKYVYEEGIGGAPFLPVPTQPVTMGFFRWVLTPSLGIDVTRVVHGEERLTLTGRIPTEGPIRSKLRIKGVMDKGEGRGALVSTCREIRHADSTEPFAVVESTTFCRGDGGCGSAGKTEPLGGNVPKDEPTLSWTYKIPNNAALIYRLSGDLNPLHIDPDYANSAGFEMPILHGLCTFGIVARPIWESLDDDTRLSQIGCRFAGPVTPGDLLTIQVWRNDDGAWFRAYAADKVVIDNGFALFKNRR